MSREVRRVPPNWEHPRYTAEDAPYPHMVGDYVPMMDKTYEDAAKEWYEGLDQWRAGTHPDFEKWGDQYDYHEWFGNPPNRDGGYRLAFDEEPTWYQVYQTVSEGTPVTPPFATREELIDYLVNYGDFAAQRWGDPKPTRERAENFVNAGWAPTFTGVPGEGLKDAYQSSLA